MHKLLLIPAVALYFSAAWAQSTASPKDKEYIEVTGEADTLIVPDEIYIEIALRERYEGREKIPLDSVEQQLKTALTAMGIALKDLSLSDASGEYVRIRWGKKDVLSSKEYMVKVSTAADVSRVFDELSKIKIEDLGIARLNHSKMAAIKKEIRVRAIRDAREKADYLMAAIGNTAGAPVRIKEGKETVDLRNSPGVQARRRFRTVASPSFEKDDKYSPDDLSFRKIKVSYQVEARFEIK